MYELGLTGFTTRTTHQESLGTTHQNSWLESLGMESLGTTHQESLGTAYLLAAAHLPVQGPRTRHPQTPSAPALTSSSSSSLLLSSLELSDT